MKNLINLSLLLLLLLCGCQANQPLATKTTVRDRLVPVALPTYFGSVKIWLECDSLGRITHQRSESNGDFKSEIKQDSNTVQIVFKKELDTIFITVKDSIAQEQIIVQSKAETPWWHKALMALGILFLIIVIISKSTNKL